MSASANAREPEAGTDPVDGAGRFADQKTSGAPNPFSSAPAPRRLGQVPALDGVRGLAVLLVLLSHTPILVPSGPTGVHVIDKFFKGGFLGVDLFFVLSGFLISALLLREQSESGRVRFGAFYGRRALRLLPALVALLGAHVLYVLIAGLPTTTEWSTVRSALLYYLNWQAAWNVFAVNSDLGHLWSLSIEEQFYIVWPAVLILCFSLRRNALTVSLVLTGLILAVCIHRLVMWDNGADWFKLFVRTDTRMDALLIGALLASIWVRGYAPSRGLPQLAWISIVLLALCLEVGDAKNSFYYRGGLTATAALFAVLILAVLDGNWLGTRLFSLRPLRAVGRVSYGLYLWHHPVFCAFARHANTWPWAARLAAGVGVAALLTFLSWRVIERPALRLKDRL